MTTTITTDRVPAAEALGLKMDAARAKIREATSIEAFDQAFEELAAARKELDALLAASYEATFGGADDGPFFPVDRLGRAAWEATLYAQHEQLVEAREAVLRRRPPRCLVVDVPAVRELLTARKVRFDERTLPFLEGSRQLVIPGDVRRLFDLLAAQQSNTLGGPAVL